MFQITFSPLPPSLIINLFLVLWGLSQHAPCSMPVIMNGKELHNGIVNSHSQKCAVMHFKKTSQAKSGQTSSLILKLLNRQATPTLQ